MKQNHKDMVHGALIAVTFIAGLVLAYVLGEEQILSLVEGLKRFIAPNI